MKARPKGLRHHRDVFSSETAIDREKSQIVLFEIAIEMRKTKLSEDFIVNAVRTALEFEGVSDLMKLWRTESNKKERNEIVADIQDMLDICNEKENVKEIYIAFNDLEKIANNIRIFKDNLLQMIDSYGGVSQLAELTGIPQPSLSRFFNSNAIPQRATLLKIAKGLKIDKIRINEFSAINEKYTRPGALLKGLRLKEGLNQKEFAEKIGVEQGDLSKMEHGKRQIGRVIARRIAEKFKVNYKLFL